MLGMLSGMATDPGTSAAGIPELESLGEYFTIILTVYGSYLLVGGGVLMLGGIFLFSSTRPNFIILAGVYCTLAELPYLILVGFGILNILGLITGLLAIWQALQLKSNLQTDVDRKSHYSIAEQSLVVIIILSLIGSISLGFLILMGKMHSAVSTGVANEMALAQSNQVVVQTADAERYHSPQPADAVSGIIKGRTFHLQHAGIQGDVLTLRQGDHFFADEALVIFLFNDHELPQNQSWEINTDTGFSSPHIHIKWQQGNDTDTPSTSAIPSGYRMTLEFGQARDGRLPGKISLSLADEHQTEVEGRFEAVIEP
ncbi:MAG: hypothetical protein KZQ58_13000 [gamma proteobacterium symbiont of Bathyaustriella thionipta]|nr:hypothetical protein [gamma proteobacterium symbiont of Bathyaustriella thionipta]